MSTPPSIRPEATAATVAVALLALAAPIPAAAQTGPGSGARDSSSAPGEEAAWSFPVGELSVYDVRVAIGRVRAPRPMGEASLAVEETDTVSGTEAYRLALEMEGGIPLVYRIDDRKVSWVATDPLRTLRFEEHLRQGDYRRDRQCRMRQEAGRYSCYEEAEEGEWRPLEDAQDVEMPEAALDEVAFLYLVRTMPLEVGRTYRFDRLFEEDGNPVELEVLRRETVRVPAGRFETIVVRPVIETGGLFGDEGRAEVYMTDDDRRLIVKIASTMKVGRIDMLLTEYRADDAP